MSATTISRALRGQPGMTDKTRQSVLATAEADMATCVTLRAQCLAAWCKTQSIMFVMPDVAPNYYSLYQMDVLGGLIDEASKHGYSITVVPERMLPGAGAELFESFRSF